MTLNLLNNMRVKESLARMRRGGLERTSLSETVPYYPRMLIPYRNVDTLLCASHLSESIAVLSRWAFVRRRRSPRLTRVGRPGDV